MKINILIIIWSITLLIPQKAFSDNLPKNVDAYHDLKIKINPGDHYILIEDTVRVSEKFSHEFQFMLNKGLKLDSGFGDAIITDISNPQDESPVRTYSVTMPLDTNSFKLKYSGRIHDSPKSTGKEFARGFKQSMGEISSEGVFLSGETYWYPEIGDGMVAFGMQIIVPSEWTAVSQGSRTSQISTENVSATRWVCVDPQDEIYLIAARFHEYVRKDERVQVMCFLRSPDDSLASKYLEAGSKYIKMYEQLIGQYPYDKFALVENFWETGYGMPSFTLLGSKIIRFPFIINSSYPHEILHNWFGNGVYADFVSGNWTEGLTAYLADHLIREQQGDGASYRQMCLQKYTDYVTKTRDFPLKDFISRHSSSSEAVGYGKSMMFFHMLRRKISDDFFIKAIKDFYCKNKFLRASFNDLQKSFEKASNLNLQTDFDQWILKPGAPEIKIGNVTVDKAAEGYLLRVDLEQIQQGDPYVLDVSVAITVEGQGNAFYQNVIMKGTHESLNVPLKERPLRIDVDPEYDLFRKLDIKEIPPALSQALGSKQVLIILPGNVHSKSLLDAYSDLSRLFFASGPAEGEILVDSDIEKIPEDRAVVILGWENKFFNCVISSTSEYNVTMDDEKIKIDSRVFTHKGHSVVLAGRNPFNKSLGLMFIASDSVKNFPGLSRKLPHYHKYSYLVFEGEEPHNIFKGRWPVFDSPMTAFTETGKRNAVKVKMGKLVIRNPLISRKPAR